MLCLSKTSDAPFSVSQAISILCKYIVLCNFLGETLCIRNLNVFRINAKRPTFGKNLPCLVAK